VCIPPLALEQEAAQVLLTLLHCCDIVVTLLLHCCYNVATLLLHCCYTVVTLLLHCCRETGQHAMTVKIDFNHLVGDKKVPLLSLSVSLAPPTPPCPSCYLL
jgi:hypothetical protein